MNFDISEKSRTDVTSVNMFVAFSDEFVGEIFARYPYIEAKIIISYYLSVDDDLANVPKETFCVFQWSKVAEHLLKLTLLCYFP